MNDAETIRRLVHDIKGPVNMLAGSKAPPIPKMKELGVSRVSVGSAIARASLALVRAAAEELRSHGTYGCADKAIRYDEVKTCSVAEPMADGRWRKYAG